MVHCGLQDAFDLRRWLCCIYFRILFLEACGGLGHHELGEVLGEDDVLTHFDWSEILLVDLNLRKIDQFFVWSLKFLDCPLSGLVEFILACGGIERAQRHIPLEPLSEPEGGLGLDGLRTPEVAAIFHYLGVFSSFVVYRG